MILVGVAHDEKVDHKWRIGIHVGQAVFPGKEAKRPVVQPPVNKDLLSARGHYERGITLPHIYEVDLQNRFGAEVILSHPAGSTTEHSLRSAVILGPQCLHFISEYEHHVKGFAPRRLV